MCTYNNITKSKKLGWKTQNFNFLYAVFEGLKSSNSSVCMTLVEDSTALELGNATISIRGLWCWAVLECRPVFLGFSSYHFPRTIRLHDGGHWEKSAFTDFIKWPRNWVPKKNQNLPSFLNSHVVYRSFVDVMLLLS